MTPRKPHYRLFCMVVLLTVFLAVTQMVVLPTLSSSRNSRLSRTDHWNSSRSSRSRSRTTTFPVQTTTIDGSKNSSSSRIHPLVRTTTATTATTMNAGPKVPSVRQEDATAPAATLASDGPPSAQQQVRLQENAAPAAVAAAPASSSSSSSFHQQHNNNYNKKPLSKAAMDSWCPHAICPVTVPICHPCQRRYLILLATGRSGSTTLQEMLGSLPGVRLSGENNGMLGHFMDAIAATRDISPFRVYNAATPPSWSLAWKHAPIPDDAFACVTQQMVETMNPPPKLRLYNHSSTTSLSEEEDNNNKETSFQDDDYEYDDSETILGFKTIRFPANLTDDAALQKAAAFLHQAFPCAKFVINLRSDLQAHAHSIQSSFLNPRKNNKNKNNNMNKNNNYNNKNNNNYKNMMSMRNNNNGGGSGRIPIQNNNQNSNNNQNYYNNNYYNNSNNNYDNYNNQQGRRRRHLVEASYSNAALEKSRTENEGLRNFALYLLQQQQQSSSSSSSGQVHVLDSTEWTKNISLLNRVVSEFLGFSTACHFDELFQLNTRNNYGNGRIQSRTQLPPGCTKLPF
ncbi:hypothetical protein ACA910_013710 [Epithemia clementina (nom. ined.)]